MVVLADNVSKNWVYGSKLPYAEPAWARGSPSPYFKDSHRRLRESMRAWTEKVDLGSFIATCDFQLTHHQYLIPMTTEWETNATLPSEIYKQAAADGVLMPMAAGNRIPKEWAGKFPIMGQVKPEEWDGFHDMIIHDEMTRVGCIGYVNPCLRSQRIIHLGTDEDCCI